MEAAGLRGAHDWQRAILKLHASEWFRLRRDSQGSLSAYCFLTLEAEFFSSLAQVFRNPLVCLASSAWFWTSTPNSTRALTRLCN